ncbi:hypothetical protein ALC60_02883 [Trachymyrmex zeteki]|uniref:DUF4817 domain-containing protein n=1 Tax=Mycetomoellerius zeteki TaxID=64791 RepID=A0A151XCP6_9HYME|nr:hypothetical protein ALC60_02883 [Trachymyrmex zeteki]
MPRTYSNSEYADMVFVYGFCNGNALKAVREYARRFPNRRVPNRRVFMLTFNRLRETGTFSIRQENNRFQAALRRDLQAGNRILQHFDNHPETSVRNASAVLGVSPQTIWRTVKGDNRYPYHIQKVQNLLPQDHWNRLNFCNWYLQTCHNDILFPSKIMWSDEATFTRGGIINQRNRYNGNSARTVIERQQRTQRGSNSSNGGGLIALGRNHRGNNHRYPLMSSAWRDDPFSFSLSTKHSSTLGEWKTRMRFSSLPLHAATVNINGVGCIGDMVPALMLALTASTGTQGTSVSSNDNGKRQRQLGNPAARRPESWFMNAVLACAFIPVAGGAYK